MPRQIKNELYLVYKIVAAEHAQRGGHTTLTTSKLLLRGPYYPILAVPMPRTRTTCKPVNDVQ